MRILESQNQQLLGQKMALESELVDLRQRYATLQSERTGRAAGNAYGLPLDDPKAQLAQSETQVRQLTCEINKANEIIRKLQDEVKSLKNRARSAETSLKQIDKVSKETQSSYEALRAELQEARNALAEKSRALAEVQADRSRLASELDETKRLVEANEKVIEWLHQQINDDSLGRMLSKHGLAGGGTSYRYPYSSYPARLSPETLLGKAKVPPPRSASSASQPET